MAVPSLPSSDTNKLQLVPSLRPVILNTVQEANALMINATRQLMNVLPLTGNLDSTTNYITSLDPQPTSVPPATTLNILKQNSSTFMLLKSVFLRRLALCFHPKFWVNKCVKQLSEVHDIIASIASKLDELTEKLWQEYEIFHSLGLNIERLQESPLAIQGWKYSEVYTSTHSAIIHLQQMLSKTRELQKAIEDENGSNVEDFPIILQEDIDSILADLEYVGSCYKEAKLHTRHIIGRNTPKKVCMLRTCDPLLQVQLDRAQEEYIVEDEVFESISTEAVGQQESDDDWQVEMYAGTTTVELDKREIEKHFSRSMLKELKMVLIDKAQEMKQREAVAVRKNTDRQCLINTEVAPLVEELAEFAQTMEIETDTVSDDADGEVSDSIADAQDQRKRKVRTVHTKRDLEINTDEIFLESTQAVGTAKLNYSDDIRLYTDGISLLDQQSCLDDNIDIKKSDKVSPLSDLPCKEINWPRPQLKDNIPEKRQSSPCASLGFDGSVDDNSSDETRSNLQTSLVHGALRFQSLTSSYANEEVFCGSGQNSDDDMDAGDKLSERD